MLSTIPASGYYNAKISIAPMSEQTDDDLTVATCCPTKQQLAIGLTKVINPSEEPEILVQFCLKPVPSQDKALVIIADTLCVLKRLLAACHSALQKHNTWCNSCRAYHENICKSR